MVRAATLALLMLAAAPAAFAQDAAALEPGGVSAERISEGLKRPELDIPPWPVGDIPTFKVKVRGDWPIETNLEFVRRQMAEEAGTAHQIVPGAGMTPPLVTYDVLPAIMRGIKYIRDVRYAHAVDDARERVAEDLAAFCAEHDCEPARPPAGEGVIAR